MNPFFFGTSEKPLYGMYHPPKAATVREPAVLLCPPMGQDYMLTHRALRLLAIQLSKAGYHVLRFDYSSTGDSWGDTLEVELPQWLSDTAAAVDELKDTSGASKVSYVGLGIGAALSAMVSARRTDVEDLVLWDPVVDGKTFVAEMLARKDVSRIAVRGEEVIGIEGFPLTKRFREQLCSIDLTTLRDFPARRLFIVISEERSDYPRFCDSLRTLQKPPTVRVISRGRKWDEVQHVGALVLPQEIIRCIVSLLG